MIKRVAWNKGIDHLSVEAKKRIGEATKLRCKEGKHPRGMLGKHHTEDTKLKQSKWRPTEEQLKKMTHHGSEHPMWSGERKKIVCRFCKKKLEIRPNLEQIYCSNECRHKGHSLVLTGRKLPVYKLKKKKKCEVCKIELKSNKKTARVCNPCKGLFYAKGKDKTKIQNKIRSSKKYKDWRNEVFKIDDYTCQHCGKRGGKLQADHYPYPLSILIKLEKIKTQKDAYKNNVIWRTEIARTLCIDCHENTDTYLNTKNLNELYKKIIKNKKIYKLFKSTCNIEDFLNSKNLLTLEQ